MKHRAIPHVEEEGSERRSYCKLHCSIYLRSSRYPRSIRLHCTFRSRGCRWSNSYRRCKSRYRICSLPVEELANSGEQSELKSTSYLFLLIFRIKTFAFPSLGTHLHLWSKLWLHLRSWMQRPFIELSVTYKECSPVNQHPY